eukprot:TRINITY_DN23642_c0_g1_i2.p1 TRINITY_DN23642_c0_g1~~TRINITY_DN23642_c0_g1_i2.p1  ORF type:complete len:420 (+),score=95.84 TRINITY_DN23642_c0_g1_i2:181-1440(+)
MLPRIDPDAGRLGVPVVSDRASPMAPLPPPRPPPMQDHPRLRLLRKLGGGNAVGDGTEPSGDSTPKYSVRLPALPGADGGRFKQEQAALKLQLLRGRSPAVDEARGGRAESDCEQGMRAASPATIRQAHRDGSQEDRSIRAPSPLQMVQVNEQELARKRIRQVRRQKRQQAQQEAERKQKEREEKSRRVESMLPQVEAHRRETARRAAQMHRRQRQEKEIEDKQREDAVSERRSRANQLKVPSPSGSQRERGRSRHKEQEEEAGDPERQPPDVSLEASPELVALASSAGVNADEEELAPKADPDDSQQGSPRIEPPADAAAPAGISDETVGKDSAPASSAVASPALEADTAEAQPPPPEGPAAKPEEAECDETVPAATIQNDDAPAGQPATAETEQPAPAAAKDDVLEASAAEDAPKAD